LGGHAGPGSAPKGAEDAAGAMPARPSSAQAPAAAEHRAVGTVESVDPAALTISLQHGPVATLKWPAMTMEFNVANAALLAGLKPGHSVSFEFVQRKPGEYVVTTIAAAPASSASGPASAPHGGH
jgi:Cu/Ag efflux protein CusF